jgi:primase-polymerase (primpol)-like protein
VYWTSKNKSSLSDEQIISWMFRHPKYRLLWEGRWREAGYPSQSEGDCAFVCKLAFLADKNPEQMDRIYRMSGLMRPKWDDRRVDSPVGKNLIQFALDNCEMTVTEYNIQKRCGEVSKLFEDMDD